MVALAVWRGADLAAQAIPAAIRAEPSGEAATFTFFNRPIVVLRARVLGRGPAERAAGAVRALDDLVGQGIAGPVASRAFDGVWLITVGSRGVFALTPPDVDEVSGETVEAAAALAVARLQQALDEAIEARSPGALLRDGALAGSVLILALLGVVGGQSRPPRPPPTTSSPSPRRPWPAPASPTSTWSAPRSCRRSSAAW